MSGVFDDLKKDFKKLYKHARKKVSKFFDGNTRGDNGCDRYNNCNNYGNYHGPRRTIFGNWYPPFLRPNSPWIILFYPRVSIGLIILISLLFCGVSLYGLIVIFLLAIIFIII